MKRLTPVLFALAAAVMGACASAPKSPIASNAPEWVNKGSGAFKDASGKQVF